MATMPANVTTKVNRSITGATTVNNNCHAIVCYNVTAIGAFTGGFVAGTASINTAPVDRYFGPGASIPSTFTSDVHKFNGASIYSATLTYSLMSGVEFINSPIGV